MEQSVAPLQPLPPHFGHNTIRMYKQGFSNRKRFERQEEAYVLSRIINQDDYIQRQHSKTMRDFQLPRREQRLQHQHHTVQLSSINSSRHSRHQSNCSTRSNQQSSLDQRRMRINDLDNIKYVKYKVDPYLKDVQTPLRRYRKKCTMANRYDFLAYRPGEGAFRLEK